jgi:heme exporter protein B
MWKEVGTLLLKDIRLELKQKYALNGILLYIVSTIFLCHLAFDNKLEPQALNALFWVILLFAAVNAISKSFVQENAGRQLYYYSLASPQGIILAKTIYNMLLMTALSVLFFVAFSLFMGSFVVNYGLFALSFFLGSLGFASLFTMISAIASRTSNNFSLMAILGFPIILPLLMLVIKVSRYALFDNGWAQVIPQVLALGAINVIIVVLSFLLFPYLWRD